MSVSESYWRTDIGRVTRSTLNSAVDKVFRKHSIELRREQSEVGDREIRFETVWTSRQVMATEEGTGVTGARTRIVINGSQVDGGLYRVWWQVENEVTSAANADWHPGPLPNEVREQYRPVLSDLELEVRTGIR